MEPAGVITDPAKLIELPLLIMERVFGFVTLIMQQSFEFATDLFRVMV